MTKSPTLEPINRFSYFSGNKECPKCHGVGSYRYDDMHSQICELCCTHPNGFMELDHEYWPEMVGKEVCVFGCGAERNISSPLVSDKLKGGKIK